MVRQCHQGQDYWCLPGGAKKPDETAEQAVLRELREECRVDGVIVRRTSWVLDPEAGDTISYLVDVGDQTPSPGHDPELAEGEPVAILMDVQWLRLSNIAERDRAFLWAAGLLSVRDFATEVERWGDEASYPGRACGRRQGGDMGESALRPGQT
jgi:ADP-ribose pyrophosphatase YjhB (NUDIX family)